MLYRIMGVDMATQEQVDTHCDLPDIEAAGGFATEKGILVERMETDDGSVVWKSEPPRVTQLVAPPDPVQSMIMQRAKNLQTNSVGCLVTVAAVLAAVWAISPKSSSTAYTKDSGSTSAGASTTATPAHMVATLDYHGSDAAYEAAVDDVLTRVAKKCNSDPGNVGAKAATAQRLLKDANVTMSLREILEAMDNAVPSGATWLDVDYAFVMFYMARQKQSNADAIRTVRVSITTENNRSASSQDGGGGKVNYSLVNTMRNAWRREGWRHKSKAEQAPALMLMVKCVETDCPDAANREATLDYIQRTIGDW